MKKFLFTFLASIIVIVLYFSVKYLSSPHTIPSSWLSYSGNDITFRYPASFGANVWEAVTWPPKVTVVDKKENALAMGCPSLQDTNMISESGGGEWKDMTYLYYKGGDIGAGQLYTSLCYIFSGNNTVDYVIDFEIHSHSGCEHGNCGAYCETPFEQECKEFDMDKDVILPIEQIISTVQLIKYIYTR